MAIGALGESASKGRRAGAVRSGGVLVLAIGAIGVVFGDIGTSPLYTLQVAGEVHPGARLERADIFGIVSLILWALTLAVSIKYVGFVMRADNRGEGGILALLSLLPEERTKRSMSVVTLLVVAGAALLFGDGMITPAISVLSAVEGLNVAAPKLKPLVVPMTCVVLVGLFAIQSRGSGHVGRLFGPVMAVWFSTVGVLGLKEVVREPAILAAISPHWGALYFARHGLHGIAILGVVVLAITGGEALYADMGHFGSRAIRVSWFTLVFPALALGYLGQGALILRRPEALAHPFFSMVPPGVPSYALVALSAAATTIASQALISGVFSLTHQAVQLGYFPRVTICHTSRETEGQIYVPIVNWSLMTACVVLVLVFKESARLASAYGIAVSGTMAITSIVFFEVTRKTWHWPKARSWAVVILFLSFDLPFFFANLTKFVDGGYVPIGVGVLFFLLMVDWRRGLTLLHAYREQRSPPLDDFRRMLASGRVARVAGTAIYPTMTDGVPPALVLQAERLGSVMNRVVLLRIRVEHEPQVDGERRHEVEPFDDHGIAQVTVRFGYMETPSVPAELEAALARHGLEIAVSEATYYVGKESFVAGKGGSMGTVAEGLFAYLSRNASGAVDHFGLPPDRVIELGTRVDL
jgi:KUP system potassium uptake protein